MTSTLYKPHPTEQMKAAQWMGTRLIQLDTVAKPTITDPADAIIHITHCTIGGADLHLYDGELSDMLAQGDILGHEAIGTVATLFVTELVVRIRPPPTANAMWLSPRKTGTPAGTAAGLLVAGNAAACVRASLAVAYFAGTANTVLTNFKHRPP